MGVLDQGLKVATAREGGCRARQTPCRASLQELPAGQGHPLESPGLDDFAHMGLITDLLE